MNKILELLTSVLAYFGIPTPRVRHYDIALDLLGQTRNNVAAILEQSSTGTAPSGATNLPEVDELLLYRQIEALRQYVQEKGLLRPDPNGIDRLGVLAADLLTRKDARAIIARLDNIATLLEIRRAVLTGTVRSIPPKATASTAATPGDTTHTSATSATDSVESKKIDLPDEAVLLWKTTEKLYESWPIKLLGALLISAVLLAGGGTLFLGGKTLELRKTLEETSEKETTSLKELAKATRETVNAQSKLMLSELDRQQNEINQRFRDFEARSTKIRDEAVERVANEIRANVSTVEKKLKEDVESSLSKIRDGDLHDLRNNIALLTKDVDDKQAIVASSAPKISALADVATDVTNLKAQAGSMRASAATAEETLRSISEHKIATQSAASGVQQLAKDIEARLKPQLDMILENERKLGGAEQNLKRLNDRILEIGIDTTRTSTILETAERIDRTMKAMSDRLDQLKSEVDRLASRSERPNTSTGEEDISREQWRSIQAALKTKGFYNGRLDGRAGPATRTAIRKYQSARSTLSNGTLTPDQIADLLGRRKS
ncbi:peptidoglycan-binding protein [Bradyrhizobium sp. HKCCYLS3077]|uniref:peptidoglycan-binding domain-containing protein n=1 Tax=Bradyrhizobium sp. HKCCYLS3077 TaxID=3420761 RepID=UPI003EB83A6D